MIRTNLIALMLTCLACFSWAETGIGKLELNKVSEKPGGNSKTVLLFNHKAVEGMDSPGYVKAGFEYHLTIGLPGIYKPNTDKTYPVIFVLHGFGDKWEQIVKFGGMYPGMITIVPNDPHGSWFYGYSDQLPGGDPNAGTVVNYTERRLLAYLDFVLKHYLEYNCCVQVLIFLLT